MTHDDPGQPPPPDTNPLAGRRLLTIRDLQTLFQCGRTAAYARVHEDDFPAPLALSDSAHRWWEHEVLAWVQRHRVNQRDRARRRPRGLATSVAVSSPASATPAVAGPSGAARTPETHAGLGPDPAPRPVHIHRRERAS